MSSGVTVELRSQPRLTKTIVQEGSGEFPEPGNVCEVHYHGTLKSGDVFDSTRSRGKTFKFRVGCSEVIKGWDIGVETMKVGEKAILQVPPEYGYGDHGVGPIPPKADLTFEIELVKFYDDTYSAVKWQVLGLCLFILWILYYVNTTDRYT